MKKPNYSGVGYLKHTYDLGGMKKLMKRAVPKLQKFRTKKHFDAIAFRGLSGASIAAILSWDLGIPMMAVRKDGSHDSDNVETYIIIDDFICSGNTIKQIVQNIEKSKYRYTADRPLAANAKLVGIFCYAMAPGGRRKRRLDRTIGEAQMNLIKEIRPHYGSVPVMYL
jgi:adenine/guanine phosphoribosyltransferase-like PRPP-binding protein